MQESQQEREETRKEENITKSTSERRNTEKHKMFRNPADNTEARRPTKMHLIIRKKKKGDKNSRSETGRS